MKFPTPPPLRTAPRPTTASPFNPKGVRLIFVVSLIFWIAVMGLLGAFIVWVLLRDIRIASGSPVLVGVALNACFAMLGYWVGSWASRMILRDVLRSSLPSNTPGL